MGYERGDGSRLSADLVPRLRRILLRLEGAARPGNMAVPGYHLHPLKGDKRGLWRQAAMATMYNPPHLGELIRESVEAKGWSVTETARRLGMGRVALSRVLNGHAGVSAALALALERIGWSDAEHWMRMQAIYDLAQERRKQAGAAA